MNKGNLINQFQRGRKDDSLVTLEGFHALKHALRFNGEVLLAVSPDKGKLLKLAEQLAPDLLERLTKLVQQVDASVYDQLTPIPPRSGVIALAKRPEYSLEAVLKSGKNIILLDDPRDHQNVGAVIRVSAAADAGAVLTTGQLDPWKPSVIRGSAGLHFALPIIQIQSSNIAKILQADYQLIGLDERGTLLPTIFQGPTLETKNVFVFGSERAGISPEVCKNLAQLVRIPMAPKVSSLNLATSVAITLYSTLNNPQ